MLFKPNSTVRGPLGSNFNKLRSLHSYHAKAISMYTTMDVNPKEGQRTTSKFSHSKRADPTWTKIRSSLFSQKKSRRHFVFFFISFESLENI